VEGAGEERAEGGAQFFATRACEDHRRLGRGELGEALAAAAAGPGSDASATTRISAISRRPLATIAAMAPASAQVPSG
jgi:hypothetical protein